MFPAPASRLTEQMGLVDQDAALQQHRRHAPGRAARRITPESMNEFTRLEQFAKLQKPPADQVQGSGSRGQLHASRTTSCR